MNISFQDEEGLADRILLEEAARKIPARQRVVLVLRMAGYTQLECGQICGTTRAAIFYIYRRALKRLRYIYQEMDQDYDALS